MAITLKGSCNFFLLVSRNYYEMQMSQHTSSFIFEFPYKPDRLPPVVISLAISETAETGR